MTPEDALAALRALANPDKAAQMAAYHKATRPCLGVANPEIDALTRAWRAEAPDPATRAALAQGLWDSDIHEARIAAGKLLTQARIREDGPVWDVIAGWVPQFDAWAVADHACAAGSRRLTAAPERLDAVEAWTIHDNFWVRRAALVMTLPWSKGRHLNAADQARRARILNWAAGYVDDREWFIQKAVAWWLRSLSRHDPAAVERFIGAYGDRMKPFARKEAIRLL